MSWLTPLRGGLDRILTRSAQPEATTPAPTPVAAVVPAWTGGAPVQRSLRDPIEPVAAYDNFAGSLATFRNPSFLAPLSHQVDPGAGGLVDGLADLAPGTPKPYAPTTDLTVRPVASSPSSSTQRPAVQRVWGSFVSAPDLDVVPMERPEVADASEVRQVADAGLTGSGSPEAPVSVARPTPVAAAPLTSAQPVVSRDIADAAASRPTPSTPTLPTIQRQLAAVPDRPARPVASPAPPTFELPVLRLAAPPAPTPSARPVAPLPVPYTTFPEPVEGPPASTFPEPVEGPPPATFLVPSATLPEPATTFPEPVEGPPPATQPEPSATFPEPVEGPPPDAPLSGFAAAIAALNAPATGPAPASDAGGPAPSAPPATPGPPQVQRSVREARPVTHLVEPVGHHHDPVAAEAARSTTADLWAGLPSLPTVRPTSAGPTVLRTVTAGPTVSRTVTAPGRSHPSPAPTAGTATSADPGSPSLAVGPSATDELPLVSQRATNHQQATNHPSVDLVGARPLLVQRQEANAPVLPPAVQPLQFTRPTYLTGPDPIPVAASPSPRAAASGPGRSPSGPIAQRLAAPGPGPIPAAVPLPAAGTARPTPPVHAQIPAQIPDQIPAPAQVVAYGKTDPEPTLTVLEPEPTSTPAAAEWSPLPTTPTTPRTPTTPPTPVTPAIEDPAAAYEVVQLAAVEDGGPGTTSNPPPLAPSVQRSSAAGPVTAPVTMAPPSRLVQRLPQTGAAAPAPGPVHTASGRTAGPVSFVSMFDGVGPAAGEDGFTSVQLLPEDEAPAAAPAPSEPPAASPAAVVGAAPTAAAPADMDELARRLFEPLSARIRAELRLDRERSGLMTDARP